MAEKYKLEISQAERVRLQTAIAEGQEVRVWHRARATVIVPIIEEIVAARIEEACARAWKRGRNVADSKVAINPYEPRPVTP